MLSRLASYSYAESDRFERNVLQSAFDFASVGLTICGRDGRMLFVNDCLCGILGYERAELAGRHWTDYICITADDSVSDGIQAEGLCAFGPQTTRLHARDGRPVQANVTM